ncbi:MAG: hypothetical protein JXA83_05980 [Acidimicrobiales bacterium]|nr:hypothetical protein [Acidimicrobiales bacterium]
MDDPRTDPGWQLPPPRELPLNGEIHFDGKRLSVDGLVLDPGEYTIPGTGGTLLVAEPESSDAV